MYRNITQKGIPPPRNSAAIFRSAFVEVICGNPRSFICIVYILIWKFISEQAVGLSKGTAESQGVMFVGFESTIGLFQEWSMSNNHTKFASYPLKSPRLLVHLGIKPFCWGHTLS